MPSLFERLGRTIARKKSGDPHSKSSERPTSTATELDGKYESISATEASQAPTEPFPTQEKSRPLQKRFSRAKSPSARPVPTTRVPVLSLHLPELNNAAVAKAQRLTFEATEVDPLLTPDVIARHRLTPRETVYLAKQMSGALHGKGLATLGIFKPHWHSALQDQQRKLITLFLQSIANTTTLPPPPGTSLEKFEAQLQTASPHDVADVLKWGLRHLQLENQSFPTATSPDGWGWYKTFAQAERAADFPPAAYSDLLLPLLPPAHQELLSTFLDIGTSVAAHAETNGVSGSKLTRLVGWWLLSQRKPASNGLVGFIQEWETAARILEHIYLAYIRDHARAGKMPKRLTQLVKSYPYLKQASPMDQHFLPRPKFTTRRRTALFVRVSSTSNDKTTYRNHPIQLLQDALHAEIDKENSPKELLYVWDELKAQAEQDIAAEEATPVAATLSLSALLTEEATRLLTSASDQGDALSPSPVALSQTSLPLRQPESSGTSRAPSDWDGFTSGGFEFMGGLNLAGGLQDYASPPSSPGKTKRRSLELGRRGSLDAKGGKPTAHANGPSSPTATKPSIVSETVASTLLLDEALIDGWADMFTDPVISSAWPTFVLYQLKTPLADPTAAANYSETPEQDPATIDWLVIETYAPAPLRRDSANGKDKDKKDKRSSSRPRLGAFFSTVVAVTTTKDKDKDKDKEGKKKEKETPGRKSSVGILKEATKSQRSLVNQTIAEEAEVPPVPKAPVDYDAVVPSTAAAAVAAVAAAGVIATVAEDAEGEEAAYKAIEQGGEQPTRVLTEQLNIIPEETASDGKASAISAVVDETQVGEPTVQPDSLHDGDGDGARAESLVEEEEDEAARIEAELAAAKAQEEERLAAEKAKEEERTARELAAQAEEEQLQQRIEAERDLEEQRLVGLAAKEEEERLAREADEKAAAEKAVEEERAAKAEAQRLEREHAEEEARLEETRLQQLREAEEAQLKREEEARQAEAEAAEKARLEELERERVREEEEQREAARLEAIRVAEEKQREEEAAAAALLASQKAEQNDEGTRDPIVDTPAVAENEAGEEVVPEVTEDQSETVPADAQPEHVPQT